MLVGLGAFVLATGLGFYAVAHWRRFGQSVRKGFGFVLGWSAALDISVGVAIALTAMAGIFLAEAFFGFVHVLNVRSDPSMIGEAALLLAGAAAFEEILFRSLLLSGLVALTGRGWLAILLSAIVFGAAHLGNEAASPIAAFGNGLGGIVYGIAFLGSRSIWLPIGMHFGWNFAQGPLLGFPVSGLRFESLVEQETIGSEIMTGGAYGPEAGLVGMAFRFVVIALVVFYLSMRTRAHAGRVQAQAA